MILPGQIGKRLGAVVALVARVGHASDMVTGTTRRASKELLVGVPKTNRTTTHALVRVIAIVGDDKHARKRVERETNKCGCYVLCM